MPLPAHYDLMLEAASHIGAAKSQIIPSDDPDIARHVREGHDLLTAALKMARDEAKAAEVAA